MKADKTTVNADLAKKADSDTVNAALALKADTTAVNAVSGRVDDIETLISGETGDDKDNIINRLAEVYAWFADVDVNENSTLADIITQLNSVASATECAEVVNDFS